MSRVYDIAFCEGDTLVEARRRAISEGTDPKGVATTVYNSEDWNWEDEYIEPGANETSTHAAVLIDGEEEPRHMAMISENDYFFPAAKKNGVEFILMTLDLKLPALIYSGYIMPSTGAGPEV